MYSQFVCLTEACENFKISVPESETFLNVWPPVSDDPSSLYPLQGLEPLADQTWIAQPSPQQWTQQESSAVPQSTPASGTTRAEPPKARRPRKRTPAVSKEDFPALEKPLSELPNNEGSDRLAEITNFANRSVEERRLEAEFDGKVKRPLNPYFLYRKAFKGAAKEPNSSAISCITAQSWAIESEGVRELFAGLGSTERLLHAQAFPDYVYEPRRAT
ncbi:hypothetical protein LA080_009618 [Diaporthe eres]|nr:hypothetical protein LA080_009618 [Diaporthe eres]